MVTEFTASSRDTLRVLSQSLAHRHMASLGSSDSSDHWVRSSGLGGARSATGLPCCLVKLGVPLLEDPATASRLDDAEQCIGRACRFGAKVRHD